MSLDFTKILVKDPTLLAKDSISYAVMKGAQNVTPATFNAISESPSGLTFNISVPSEQIIVSRKVYWQSTVTLTITNNLAGPFNITTFGLNYGLKDALAPFPLHSLCNTLTAQINANSITMNVRDVLPALLRMIDMREFERYNCTTPTLCDSYLNYEDAQGTINNPLGSYDNANFSNGVQGRGAWELDSLQIENLTAGNLGKKDWYTAGGTFNTCYATFTVQEPLLMSPFLFGNASCNSAGFFGIQNMTFTMNQDSNATRVWRKQLQATVAGVPDPYSYSVNYSNSKLNFLFLTPHPSDLFSSRCVSPYYELPRYISTPLVTFLPIAPPSASGIVTVDKKIITSSTIQLNQVPDSLVIFLRKPIATTNNYDSDFFLVIEACAVSFNNNSGLLANATQYDLWRFSRESGSNQSYNEFKGEANMKTNMTGGTTVPLCGSVLMLEFGRHIQLTDDFYASGSLGTFSLQVTLTVSYQQTPFNMQGAAGGGGLILPVARDPSRLLPITPELVIITKNSGIFVTSRGGSSVFTGLLDKQSVLDTSEQIPYSHNDVYRMTGGSFLDSIKSAIGSVLPKLPTIAKHLLGQVNHPAAKTASTVLGLLGHGESGGVDQGMGASAGSRKGRGESGGVSAGRKSKLASRLIY